MIKSLDITNFQSHEDTHLEFHPGVNIIVGSSDSGKTAIVRSIKKLAFNKPSGGEMQSNWGGEMRIEMFTDDAHIALIKDKQQEYILGDTHFTAFGTSVPEEIVKALNLNEINLQQQLDSPFLLSETPGAVATHFNKIAKLDKIDSSTANINSWIRELTADIKYAEGQEIALKEGLTKFDHLEMFEADVEVLEEMDRKYVTLIQNKQKLRTLHNDIEYVLIDIETAAQILEIEEPLNQIFELKDKKDDMEANYGDLLAFIKSIKVIQEEIEQQRELIPVENTVNNLLELYKEKKAAESERNLLSKALSSINSINIRLTNTIANHKALALIFNREMPDQCPLCGSLIPHDHNEIK